MEHEATSSSAGIVCRPARFFRVADLVLCVGIALAVAGFAPGQVDPEGCSCDHPGNSTKAACGSCPGTVALSTECTQCCAANICTSTDSSACGPACQAELPDSGRGGKEGGGSKDVKLPSINKRTVEKDRIKRGESIQPAS